MKKLLPVLFASLLIAPVFADDDSDATVVARQTCAEIKATVDSLSAQDDLDETDETKLHNLRAEYRSKCVARAGARRTSRGHRPPVDLPPESVPVSDTDEEITIDDKIAEIIESDGDTDTTNIEPPTEPEKTEEEIIAEIEANLASGLCPDGEKPNTFGCCKNETFKDMGRMGFNCCPKDGGDCYPPIK